MLTITRNDATCRRVMTVLGVGPVVALAYAATIDIPQRFRSSKAVAPILRLTPKLDESGESKRVGCISLCGDGMMRTLLYETAQTLMTRVTKWS
ncbi:IS110 family transposase [Mesorhizobium sp.]|uniref:IS110 family transposase n=1 Tax=Mesorhizobium sp. TaxID=1871066 RepID=UPI0032AF7630